MYSDSTLCNVFGRVMFVCFNKILFSIVANYFSMQNLLFYSKEHECDKPNGETKKS